jgi:peptidoglycan/LPS O-acetylase OafA/YrhL
MCDSTEQGDPAPVRVAFVDALRGVAVLCVLTSHLLGVFWMDPAFVGELLHAPPLNSLSTPPAIAALHFSSWFNYGSFGVALFFLISGFVIPFSLARAKRRGFLLGRVCRIYPVYCVAFSLSSLAISMLAWAQGKGNFVIPLDQFIAQVLGLRGWLGFPNMDGVSWTLEIELIFYVMAACFSTWMVRGGLRFVTLYAFVCTLITVGCISVLEWVPYPRAQVALAYCAFALPFTVYMLLGTLLFQFHTGYIRGAQLVQGGMVVLLCFSVALQVQPTLKSFASSNYVLALFLFASLYFLRAQYERIAWLEWFARISYPLYAVHAVLGLGILYVMVLFGYSIGVSLLACSITVLLIAVVLHHVVEKPFHALGRKLALSC